MSILFGMPNWPAPSELWLHRTLDLLKPQLSGIFCADGPATWENIPILPLQGRPNTSQKVLHALGKNAFAGLGRKQLIHHVNQPSVEHVFFNFLDFALNYQEELLGSGKHIHVQCHGKDVTWDLRRHKANPPARFPADYMERAKAFSGSVRLVANSAFTRDQLTTIGIPAERISIRCQGVPVPEQAPEHAARPDVLHVLYIGRLVDFKGPLRTMEAFERACDQGLNGRLSIAGNGPLGPACRMRWAHSPYRDRMELLGSVDRETGERLRREADLFTAHNKKGEISNQQEGYGVAFAEAMADGLPVVTGNSGALPELVVHDQTGLLFEPGDVEAHAACLLALGADPDRRLQMGRAGWERAREHLSLAEEARQLKQMLEIP